MYDMDWDLESQYEDRYGDPDIEWNEANDYNDDGDDLEDEEA